VIAGRNGVRLTPELLLIGQVLSADWTSGARRQWAPALFEHVDWPTFGALVWQHKLRPMAVSALEEAGWPGVPAAVRETLQRDAESCVLVSMRQLEAQSTLAPAASSLGIRFVSLKGLALSTHLYRDPLIRESFDFDLLVDPGDMQRMKELLRGIGFEPLHPKAQLSPRQTAILARFFHEEKFVNRVTGIIVDVHHALAANPWRMATCFEDLWRNRQNVRVGRGELSIPGNADLIQYLGAHAATHGWERWKWIGDLLALYRQSGTASLLAQRSAAHAAGWACLFDSSLLVTSAVTGWELSPELREICGRNRDAVRLARRSLNFSVRPATRTELRGLGYAFRLVLFRLRLRRHPRYIAHELAAWFHRPLDWYKLQFADSMIPAYYLLRPLLLIGRGISHSIRGVWRNPGRPT
jgi:hypothetical protein